MPWTTGLRPAKVSTWSLWLCIHRTHLSMEDGGCFSISFCSSWLPRAITPGISGLMPCGLSLHALPEPSGRKCRRWTRQETIGVSENCPVSLQETSMGAAASGHGPAASEGRQGSTTVMWGGTGIRGVFLTLQCLHVLLRSRWFNVNCYSLEEARGRQAGDRTVTVT